MLAQEAALIDLTWEMIAKEARACLETWHEIQALKRAEKRCLSTGYQAVWTDLSEIDGVLLRGNRIVIQVALTKRVV